ncbi:MAG: nucleotidyltransferase domain-containing protein [Spirochaetaceae bacterium]|nr:nucleotidyltransferase domain-containing protein [Spirochaetaceae bacterium]MCF7939798.1 nucleotidyltransferase domain-containing protein [Spirochaetales bacterium]
MEIFGSRAMGNYNFGSDIDLVLQGSNLDKKSTFDGR